MREFLVLTSAYARPYVQTLGEGEGRSEATRREEENAISFLREIARCEKEVSLKVLSLF